MRVIDLDTCTSVVRLRLPTPSPLATLPEFQTHLLPHNRATLFNCRQDQKSWTLRGFTKGLCRRILLFHLPTSPSFGYATDAILVSHLSALRLYSLVQIFSRVENPSFPGLEHAAICAALTQPAAFVENSKNYIWDENIKSHDRTSVWWSLRFFIVCFESILKSWYQCLAISAGVSRNDDM